MKTKVMALKLFVPPPLLMGKRYSHAPARICINNGNISNLQAELIMKTIVTPPSQSETIMSMLHIYLSIYPSVRLSVRFCDHCLAIKQRHHQCPPHNNSHRHHYLHHITIVIISCSSYSHIAMMISPVGIICRRHPNL